MPWYKLCRWCISTSSNSVFSYLAPHSVLSRSLGAPPVPHYYLQGAHASDSVPEVAKHGRPFQTPEQAQYGGASGLYHRCK
nr:protein gar2-like isoform X3 [Ipomoea batatas]